MTITTVGIDLAKNVFAVHCIDQNGKAVLVKPKVSRAALSELIAGLPPVSLEWKLARPLLGKIIQAVWP
jgi:transposase